MGIGRKRVYGCSRADLPHAVIPRASAVSKHDGELGHVCTSHRRDELGTILGDAALFGIGAYHEAADILEKDEWNASPGA